MWLKLRKLGGVMHSGDPLNYYVVIPEKKWNLLCIFIPGRSGKNWEWRIENNYKWTYVQMEACTETIA